MRDPARLLDHAKGLEAMVLSSGLDYPAPRGLLDRTVEAVALAAPAAVVLTTTGVATGTAKATAAIWGGSGWGGSGLFGAAAVGAIAGVVAVGGASNTLPSGASLRRRASLISLAPSAPSVTAPAIETRPPAPIAPKAVDPPRAPPPLRHQRGQVSSAPKPSRPNSRYSTTRRLPCAATIRSGR